MSGGAAATAIPAPAGLRTIIGHVLTTLMSKVWVFALGLALASLRGRVLGPELFAAVIMALALPNFLLSLFNMGVSASNVFFIGRGEITPALALRSSLRMAAGLGLLGCLLGGTTLLLWKDAFFPGIQSELLGVALIIYPVLLVRLFVMSLIHAAENFRWFNGILSCEAACVLIITAVAFSSGGGALSAIAAFGIAAFIGLCLCVIPLRRQLAAASPGGTGGSSASGVADATPNESYAWRCLNYGWKANLSNLLAFLNHRSDLFLINAFVTPAAAGIYAGATMVTERMWILSQSVSTVILPRLSRLNTDDPSRQRLTRLVSNIVFVSTLGLSLVLAFAGEFILAMLLGPKFIPAGGVLVWLLPGTVLASLARVLANDLAARGYVGWNVWNAGVLVVVNVVSNLWLIPRFGIVGAAWSSSLGWTVYTILALVVYCRLNPTKWWELMIPRAQDVASLVQLCRDAWARTFNRLRRHISGRPAISWSRRLSYVSLCCIGGMFLTSILEYQQSEAIVPLRNLWLYGQTSSHADGDSFKSQYRHGEATNPVHVAQLVRDSALTVLDDIEKRQPVSITADEHERILQVADHLIEMGIERISTGKDALSFRLWAYDFDYPTYGLKKPWFSGMAQGHVVEVELAAYHLTNDRRYLETACDAARALAVPIEHGGVAVVLSKGHGLWFEEYASPVIDPPAVLNGHNFALNGLWHLKRIEPEFRPLFEAGVRGVHHRLPEFDIGIWSRYDLRGLPANQKYQMIHVAQLRELFERTGEPRFAEYASIFQRQLYSPWQVPYRLWVHPHRMLVLLCVLNGLCIVVLSQVIHYTVVRSVNRRMSVYRKSVRLPLPSTSPAVSISRAA
ncbi:MAG: D-glucuronyl C5-epimerase family protein [Planctomycetaceae bacterium]